MKRSGYYYDVSNLSATGGLVVYHRERVEDLVVEINQIVNRARERGFIEDEKWLIVAVEWEKEWDEDGVFVQSSEKRRAVAFYDNGVVTDI